MNRLFRIDVQNDAFFKFYSISNLTGDQDDLKKIKKSFFENLKCSVCQEIFIDTMVIECGHNFCNHCIEEWQKNFIEEISHSKKLQVIDIPLSFKKPYKVKKIKSARYILESLNLAHELSINKKILGFINCSIDKSTIFKCKLFVF